MPRIQSNREAIDDRFSVLGFTVRTESPLFEVAVATDPALFHADRRAQRSRRNFYSSRSAGALRARRGEAVYLVPPDVLANFVGQQKLWFGLATYGEHNGGKPDHVQSPGDGTMYVSLAGLTERGLRRLNPGNRASSYGHVNGRDASLEWGGDAWPQAAAAAQPVPPSNTVTPPAPATTAPYDDGFGRFPDATATTPAATTEPPTPAGTPPIAATAQALARRRAAARPFTSTPADAGDDSPGIEGPIPELPPTPAAQALGGGPSPEYPQATRYVPAAPENYSKVPGPRTIDKVVIHITDGGPKIDGTIAWFQNPQAQVSAHYVIGQDGEVVQMVLHNDKAWHARRANTSSIGIEHVANTRGLKPTNAQLCASAALVTWLCDTYGIPADRQHVLGHSEADTGTSHTGCPNAVWDWPRYMQLIETRSCLEPAAAVAQSLQRRARRAIVRAQEIIQPFYDPADASSALVCQDDAFSQAREEWFVGVPNTRIFPHSAICKLRMSAADGKMYAGTGFYIGPNRILTCAHNLHNKVQVEIIPARNGAGDQPYGKCTVPSSSWRVAPSYTGSGNWANDLAVIDDVPIAAPNGQWFGFLNATPSDQLPVVVCGYAKGSPAVPELTKIMDGDKQHLHGGYVHGQSDLEVIEYPLLTLKGASGSPVYTLSRASGQLEALVCAVHVTGEPAAQGLNRGCFLTPTKLDWIEGRASAFALRAAGRNGARALGVNPKFAWPATLAEGNFLVKAYIEAYDKRMETGYTGAPPPDPRQFNAYDPDAEIRNDTLGRYIGMYADALKDSGGRSEVNRAILAVTTAVTLQAYDEVKRLLPAVPTAGWELASARLNLNEPPPQPSADFALPRSLAPLSARIGMLMAWIDVAIQRASADTAERLRMQREQWEMLNAAASAGFSMLGLVPQLGTAMTFVGTLVQGLIGQAMPDFERSYASFGDAMRAVRRAWQGLPATMLKGLIMQGAGTPQLVVEVPLHPDAQAIVDAHAGQALLAWEQELAFLGYSSAGAEPRAQALSRAPRARAADLFDLQPVDLKLRVFIPAPVIYTTRPVVSDVVAGGDGRSFQADAGTSRCEIAGRFHFGRGDAKPKLTDVTRRFGESTNYAFADTVEVPGKPDWWRELKAGAQATERGTQTVTDDRLGVRVGGGSNDGIVSMAEGSVVVTFDVHASDPIVSLAAEIDATLAVHLRVQGDRVQARVRGGHDEFPAYELYANGHLVYSYDPVAAGGTPYGLLGDGVWDVNPETSYVDVGPASEYRFVPARIAEPQGFAARRSSRAFGGSSISVHWDDVPFYPQTSPKSCWAASAAMIVGWRDRVSIADQSIADMVPVIDGYRTGLWPRDRSKLADAWGLVAEPPASYTIDAWAQMLEQHGPLYIDMTWSGASGGHVRVLVGMTSDGNPDGSGTTMYMHDPWPDTPGRIKLSFADFLTLYENRTGNSGGNLQYQILHADTIPAGVQPVTAAPFSLTTVAEAESNVPVAPTAPAAADTIAGVPVVRTPMPGADATTTRVRGLSPPPVPVVQQQQLRARAFSTAPEGVEVASPIAGATVRRIIGGNDEVQWQLDQLHGYKHPNDYAPAEARAAQDGEVLHLSSWPAIDADDGTRVCLDLDVRWQHDGLSVGNVRVVPIQARVAAGHALAVRASLADDPALYPTAQPTCAAVRLRVDYLFTLPDGGTQVATYDAQLFGNGKLNLAGRWATPSPAPQPAVTA